MAQAESENRLSPERLRNLRGHADKKSKGSSPKALPVGSVWDMIASLRAQVPIREWDKLPTDLAKNIDHYLYGAKKNSR